MPFGPHFEHRVVRSRQSHLWYRGCVLRTVLRKLRLCGATCFCKAGVWNGLAGLALIYAITPQCALMVRARLDGVRALWASVLKGDVLDFFCPGHGAENVAWAEAFCAQVAQALRAFAFGEFEAVKVGDEAVVMIVGLGQV